MQRKSATRNSTRRHFTTVNCCLSKHDGKRKRGVRAKSVLDIIYQLSEALKPALSLFELKTVALQSIDNTLNEFRQKPNLLGRARMFPEKSMGLDDPGMLAIKVIVEAI